MLWSWPVPLSPQERLSGRRIEATQRRYRVVPIDSPRLSAMVKSPWPHHGVFLYSVSMMLLSSRRRRRFRIISARWQRRALFLLGGVAVGAAAVALAELADVAQMAFAALVSRSRYISLALTPAGFALALFLTNRVFRNAQGSGIPQAIAARHLTDQAARGRLVSLRIAAGKIVLTLF